MQFRKLLMLSWVPAVVVLCLCAVASGPAQPRRAEGGVEFRYRGTAERSVSVIGDFNGWTPGEHRLRRQVDSTWAGVVPVRPGVHQYLLVLDGDRSVVDPANPVRVDSYNRTSTHSVFVLTETGEVLLTAEQPRPAMNLRDEYPRDPARNTLFLNIIWHQHQPLYANPETDQLTGPWVRTHATKDYYDMAAILRGYPDVHCTINLTSSLLLQLRSYYVDRLLPFMDTKANKFDVEGFLRRWRGKTDPWIDLALKPASEYTEEDLGHLYRNPWNCFSVSEVMLARFPEFQALRERLTPEVLGKPDLYSEQERRQIIFWFYACQFDPDFLRGPVRLPDGSVCDLTWIVEERGEGMFYLRHPATEDDCRRIVLEATKVMAAVIPVHRELRYDPARRTGQVDIITTPYYHPILPLVYDTDLAAICQPGDPLPGRYSYPDDAEAHVVKAVKMYNEIFGTPPTGMWPGEGSIAQPVLEILRRHGILWTAGDVKVLQRSRPEGQPNTTPYQFPAGKEPMSIVFRDTELSDRIGFKYQSYEGEIAAEDFVRSILAFAPRKEEKDVLVTVILDGENAWEWYQKDIDGKSFLHALYRKLTALYRDRRVVTTTMIEYLRGNPARGIPAHPVELQPRMEWLWPGSWINGNFDTWIGEDEENAAWEYLRRTREDLARSGVPRPDPHDAPPPANTPAWYAYMAWEEMYASEGSDWFWWYGRDQAAPGGDHPFDTSFRVHLRNVYRFARLAGAKMDMPEFPAIIAAGAGAEISGSADGRGTMARGSGETRRVVFHCDARAEHVPAGIFIVGNHELLGSWKPNTVLMRDDGLEGDEHAGDGMWSFAVDLPVDADIHYKFTNSGVSGQWTGEEFPLRHRTVRVTRADAPLHIRDQFGK